MAFLTSLAGYVVTHVLAALGGWLLKELHIWAQDRAANKADESKNAAVRSALESAKTPAERESAARGAADAF